jgi:agmatine deiminase
MNLELKYYETLSDRPAQSVSHELNLPAEWSAHRACWLAWPSHPELWNENFSQAQKEFIGFCHAIADYDSTLSIHRGEALEVLVPNQDRLNEAQKALKGLPVRFHLAPFGDIWLRDTAPIFVRRKNGAKVVASFRFNGWGGKYALDHDSSISSRIALMSGAEKIYFPWVFEGGAMDVDGEGTALATRQSLLNLNRALNDLAISESEMESRLRTSFGIQKVLWLNRGLANDHGDGLVDNVARFVSPGVVLCLQARSSDDPNRRVFEEIYHDLLSFRDARNRSLMVIPVPSPGIVLNSEGRLLPASYLNFYIGNSVVVVPTFGSPQDQDAIAIISQWFLGRKVIGLPARALLSGGGAFHAISQQEPV